MKNPIKIVEIYGQTKEDYLSKYPKVVNLLNNGISQRLTAKRTGESINTVKKVNIVNKYCGKSPNPYLEKYSDVVREIKNNKTQREVAANTGVSVPVVNTVAQVALIDYVRKFKNKAIKKNKKKAKKEDQALETYSYINKIYGEFALSLPKTPTGGDYSPNVFQCKKFIKTVKIAEGHTKKDWVAGIALIFKGVDKIVESRLKEIERKKAKKAKKLAKQNLYISPETKRRHKEETKKLYSGLLDKYLNAGINPFDEKWNADQCPMLFKNLQCEGVGIDSLWLEDQKKIEKIRKMLPNQNEYAEKHLQLFNGDFADQLLNHRKKMLSPKTSDWKTYQKQKQMKQETKIKEDMRKMEPLKYIEIYGMEGAF